MRITIFRIVLFQVITIMNSSFSQIVSDFQVNENVGSCSHSWPKTANLSDSTFVIVWLDARNVGREVYGQIVNKNGKMVGRNFRTTNETERSYWQRRPVLDSNNKGEFIVVWADARGNSSVYGNKFNRFAESVRGDLLIGENSRQYTSFTNYPCVCLSNNGFSLVCWMSYDGDDENLYAKLFDENFDPVKTIKVNDISTKTIFTYPQVCALENGNYFVTWLDRRNNDTELFAQILDSLANPINTNFKIDMIHGLYLNNQHVVKCAEDFMVVAWTNFHRDRIYLKKIDNYGNPIGTSFFISNPGEGSVFFDYKISSSNLIYFTSSNNGTDSDKIVTAVYDTSGNQIMADFHVSDSNIHTRWGPSISGTEDGDYFISWTDTRNGNTDIYGQLFSKDHSPLGHNIRMNDDYGNSIQIRPNIVPLGNTGNLIISWYDTRDFRKIYYQIISSTGEFIGDNQPVLVDLSYGEYESSIAADDYGNFIIVFEAINGIGFQLFNEVGNSKNDYQLLEKEYTSRCVIPSVVFDSDGNFIMTWQEGVDVNNDDYRIFAQKFYPDGTEFCPVFEVSEQGKVNSYADISVNEEGDFVITWTAVDHETGFCYVNYRIYNRDCLPVTELISLYDPWGNNRESRVAHTNSNHFYLTCLSSDSHYNERILIHKLNYDGSYMSSNYNHIHTVENYYYKSLDINVCENGDYIISWIGYTEDRFGIKAAKFNKFHDMLGKPFQINESLDNSGFRVYSLCLYNGLIYSTWEEDRISSQKSDVYANILSFYPYSEEKSDKFTVFENYPNPFNSYTIISYHLPKDEDVDLSIYNLRGQHIVTLVDETQRKGFHSVAWKGLDKYYNRMGSGIFICKLTTPDEVSISKLSYIK